MSVVNQKGAPVRRDGGTLQHFGTTRLPAVSQSSQAVGVIRARADLSLASSRSL
jgi:hypothetical protein